MAYDDGNLATLIDTAQQQRVDPERANSSVFDVPGHRTPPAPPRDAESQARRNADGGFMGRFSPWELHPGYAFEVCGQLDR
jgi:hypothetical protein